MNIGIVQGRLLPPIDGKIQEFPDNWRNEFFMMDTFGLSHIEFIVTKKSLDRIKGNYNNIESYSNSISAICADNLINKSFYKPSFLSHNLQPICEFAMRNSIQYINIPLLEESSVNIHNINMFIYAIKAYIFVYPELKFNVEMDCEYKLALDILKSGIDIGFVYDTGNITAAKYNHKYYIESIFPYITTVHLKDRKKSGQSVEIGEGDTDFELIFATLANLGYEGKFTIQSARGEEGKEMETIGRHKAYFQKLYDEKFI